mgnify:CR=1 FL=1
MVFLYAVHIIVCEKAMKKTSPIIITALQFAFASIFSFIAASLFEDISVVFHIDSSIYLQILYLAFFATTLCYLFQNVGQKFVNENIAALLLSLESVFGVFLFHIIWTRNNDTSNWIRIYDYFYFGFDIRNKVIFFT